MTEIKLKSKKERGVAELVIDALETEGQRLNYSLSLARKHLDAFEEKYDIASEKFIAEWTAEDLDGKDLEYVEWAGEYNLASRLQERLETISGIEYVP